MENLGALNLIKSIQSVSYKYKNLKLKDTTKEVDDNKKINSLLSFYKGRMVDIQDSYNFLAKQTRDGLKNDTNDDITDVLTELNNFSLQKYKLIKSTSIDSTTLMAVTYSTVDELIIVNNSIRNKEYINNKTEYLSTYKEVLLNAFMTFLALKDVDWDKKIISDLSQSVFTQLQALAIISM